MRIFPADGGSGFSPARNFPCLGQITSKTAITDFNGDGKLDGLIGTTIVSVPGGGTGSAIFILLGDGAGGLEAPFTFELGPGAGGIVTGDFTGDSKVDLVVG